MFNVANRAIFINFIEMDKTVIKEETVVHLHKTNKVKDNLNMGMATIKDLLLGVKVVKTWRKGSSIHFMGDSMHMVNVGPRDKVMVIVIVEETIIRQPDKVISVDYPVANPQQVATYNMRRGRPHGGVPNEFRPPNLYYDHGNARQTSHLPAGLQTANGYIPIEGRQGGPPNFDNRRQPSYYGSGSV